MEQKLMQTENIGMVVGLLKEKNIKFGQSKAGNNYANGNIVVEVSNEYGVSEIRIDVMQMEKYANGNDNKAYKSLMTINESYATIKENGRENAELIRVYVKLEENNYYSKQEDEIREGMKLIATTDFDKGFFTPISRETDPNAKHIARVSFGGRINGIQRKEDGTLMVDIVGVNYSGKAIKHKLTVDQDKASAFESTYFEGCTTTLYYVIVDAVELKQAIEEVAFGEGSGMTIEKRIRKNAVVGGANPNPNGITQEQMTHILAMRTAELQSLLDTKRNEAQQMTQKNDVAFGFGGNQVHNTNFGGNSTGFGGVADNSNPFGMQ